MKELALNTVQSQLKGKNKLAVDERTMDEIKLLAENPDYGPEFLDVYLDHLNVLDKTARATPHTYLCAVKFFILVESEHTLTDAYIKTFPDRYEARKRNHPDSGPGDKDFMRGEASRYNRTLMLQEIRTAAHTPVQLIHRHTFHWAIQQQADLAANAKSEMVRQKAGEVLIRELKPLDDTVLAIDVTDGAKSAIEGLRLAAEKLAVAEQRSVNAGVPLKTIAHSRVYESEVVDENGS